MGFCVFLLEICTSNELFCSSQGLFRLWLLEGQVLRDCWQWAYVQFELFHDSIWWSGWTIQKTVKDSSFPLSCDGIDEGAASWPGEYAFDEDVKETKGTSDETRLQERKSFWVFLKRCFVWDWKKGCSFFNALEKSAGVVRFCWNNWTVANKRVALLYQIIWGITIFQLPKECFDEINLTKGVDNYVKVRKCIINGNDFPPDFFLQTIFMKSFKTFTIHHTSGSYQNLFFLHPFIHFLHHTWIKYIS